MLRVAFEVERKAFGETWQFGKSGGTHFYEHAEYSPLEYKNLQLYRLISTHKHTHKHWALIGGHCEQRGLSLICVYCIHTR